MTRQAMARAVGEAAAASAASFAVAEKLPCASGCGQHSVVVGDRAKAWEALKAMADYQANGMTADIADAVAAKVAAVTPKPATLIAIPVPWSQKRAEITTYSLRDATRIIGVLALLYLVALFSGCVPERYNAFARSVMHRLDAVQQAVTSGVPVAANSGGKP